MAWTTPKTDWVAGVRVTETHMNAMGQNLSALYPAMCRATHGVDQSISDSTLTTLALTGAESYDTDSMHSTSSNTGRITVQRSGKYIFGFCVSFSNSDTDGYRRVILVHSGGSDICQAQSQASTSGATILVGAMAYNMAASEYVEIKVFQNSGSAINVLSVTAYSPVFWAQRIGDV